MTRVKIKPDPSLFPAEFRGLLSGADVYDSSCSPEARVFYIERDGGLFLKCAARHTLAREAELAAYFHRRGLTAEVLSYRSLERDWLLTRRVRGEDATAARYLADPRRLARLSGELLRSLHELPHDGCPVPDRMHTYFETVRQNFEKRQFDLSFAKYATAEEAYRVAIEGATLLRNDTLIHGDYCLPNFLLDDWRPSGFIDLGNAGVGDRHVDLFWGAWTLGFNLHTDAYRDLFFDAYGRDRINPDAIEVIAAAEVFG